MKDYNKEERIKKIVEASNKYLDSLIEANEVPERLKEHTNAK